MTDRNHPFLRPLWRRVALVAFCVAWAGFEYFNGATGWAVLAAVMAAYGVWQFFIAWPKTPDGGG